MLLSGGAWLDAHRSVTLVVDGEVTAVETYATTVGEVLDALGAGTLRAPGGRRSLVRPSRMSRVESGMVVELADPVALTIAEGDERVTIVTDKATVGAVLARAGVELRAHDRGPFVDGRVIDLNRAAFAELASPSQGVIRVRIEW